MYNLSSFYFLSAYINHWKYSKGSASVCSAGGPHAAHTGMHVYTHTPHFIVIYLLDLTMILLLRLRFLSGKCEASSRELCVHILLILITCKFL